MANAKIPSLSFYSFQSFAMAERLRKQCRMLALILIVLPSHKTLRDPQPKRSCWRSCDRTLAERKLYIDWIEERAL